MNIKEINNLLRVIQCNEDDHAAEEYDEDFIDPKKLAAQRKQLVEFALPHELLIDLDSEESLQLFLRRIAESTNGRFIVASEGWSVTEACVRPSKTEGHYHAKVNVDVPIADDYQKIIMQMFYGSDPIRETMNLKRVIGCVKDWNRLFYQPDAVWEYLSI